MRGRLQAERAGPADVDLQTEACGSGREYRSLEGTLCKVRPDRKEGCRDRRRPRRPDGGVLSGEEGPRGDRVREERKGRRPAA